MLPGPHSHPASESVVNRKSECVDSSATRRSLRTCSSRKRSSPRAVAASSAAKGSSSKRTGCEEYRARATPTCSTVDTYNSYSRKITHIHLHT